MIVMEQTRIGEFDSSIPDSDDWTYEGADTNYMTHGLHPYPARMIPQVAGRLIREQCDIGDLVWDPFCGSGTVLVESMLRGRESVGTDLNPFAIFLSKVKTTPIEKDTLGKTCQRVIESVNEVRESGKADADIPDMLNIDYWFKPYVKQHLAEIRQIVFSIEDSDVRDFFRICMASTVRDVSNLKKREFKIVRMKTPELAKFKPDVYGTFIGHVNRCRPLMESFADTLPETIFIPEVHDIDNRKAPIDEESIDLIVTSPPYGDHSTTVAYGQFSRYPGLWIGLQEERMMTVDRRGLGGSRSRVEIEFTLESDTLTQTFEKVKARSKKRSEDLYRFYIELNGSLESMFEKLRSGAKACIVVGNRSMSRVRIPTHLIIPELSKSIGFVHDNTIPRDIPTKRMPWQNAPENVEGSKADTMHNENIVFLSKP